MCAIRPPPRHAATRRGTQQGQGLIEFSLVAAPVLMAGLGAIELAHWLTVKQAVSLALLEAGRAGITQNARPEAMEAAFEHALRPLFPAAGGQDAARRRNTQLAQRAARSGGPPWQIRIMQPGPDAFTDFASREPALAGRHGGPVINNSYQAEQHQRHIAGGWAQGRGPRSGLTVFEANTLVLRVSYLHEPALPGMKSLIRQLAPGSESYAARAMATGGYLPMSQEIRLTMQSHPMQWPDSASGKVVGAGGGAAVTPTMNPEPCTGIWCLVPAKPPAASPPASDQSGTPLPPFDEVPAGTSASAQYPPPGQAGDAAARPPAIDPECGVTLCCLTG